jgi:RNA polymerase sigma-70 factor (ECF subfamily)
VPTLQAHPITQEIERAVTDPPDFAEFYGSSFDQLCVQLYVHTGDLAEAQDVVQEAFCRALARWDRIAFYEDPVAWVRKVAWNLATSRWRRVRTAMTFANRQRHETAPGPDGDRVDLVAALAALPPRQRQAVVLHYLGDVAVAEIAEIIGAAEGTVKSWLHRARRQLQGKLGEVGDE